MTRGVAHPQELRSEAVAAVLGGATLSETARQFNISIGTLSTWLAAPSVQKIRNSTARARDPESIEVMLLDLITQHVTTLSAQLQVTARPEWIEKQPAADLAQLVGVQRDTLLRLLAGLRPVPVDQPALPEMGGSSASDPADG